jgi:hypothetical protein
MNPNLTEMTDTNNFTFSRIAHPSNRLISGAALLSISAWCCLASAEEAVPKVITPRETIDLLEVLSGPDRHFQLDVGKSVNSDPEKVWRFNADGGLRINGEGLGYVRTAHAYQNYHLVIDYRWGELTHGPRKDRARDGGLLLHCFGPDGALGGSWPSCIEVQMIEGGSGNILILAAKDETGKSAPTQATFTAALDRNGDPVWAPGGETRTYPVGGRAVTRIGWKSRDPGWTDQRGYRGANDVEKPLGEWNRMEVVCEDTTLRVILNGIQINEATGIHPLAGYIGIKSEFADYDVRRWELHPIGAFDDK